MFISVNFSGFLTIFAFNHNWTVYFVLCEAFRSFT